MSFATDMLTKVQTAYANALNGQAIMHSGRSLTNYDIEKLRGEVLYWEKRVAAEESTATGTNYRKPIQVVL